MILRLFLILVLSFGCCWCNAVHKNVLMEMIMEEDMRTADPLEWMPDWIGNKEALLAVVKQMKESTPEYRMHYYKNVEGLSFGEVMVILQNLELDDQKIFLPNDVILRLRPTVFTAFRPVDLPNYPTVTFRYSALKQILNEFHPDTLIALIERHLMKYSFFDKRLAHWILKVSAGNHLGTKTWSPSALAWESFNADTILLASRADTELLESIMKIFLVFPKDLDRLVRFRIGIRRVVRIKLILYNHSADLDDANHLILKKALDNLVILLLQLFSKLCWTEKENFAVIATWLAHLHDQSKGGWWSSGTPHPPTGHLIETLLLLESVEHPKEKFERRWQWPILQVLMPESGLIPNLASFVQSLVIDADPKTIGWEEVSGLCVETHKYGYLGVWRRMIEVFKNSNEVVYKKMSEMETLIYVDTFDPPEAPSKDCIIQ